MSMDHRPEVEAYVATLEEVSRLLVEEQSLDELLEQILELTARSVTSSAAASVTVVGDDEYATAASSDPRADAVDAVQYELGEGPCIDTLQTGREHHLLDLASEERWPTFVERARDVGFDGVLSVPLATVGGTVVGALNLFVVQPAVLSDDDVHLARRIAAPAATTLANARAYRRMRRLADQLQFALDSRAIIEQAKGVLMARQGCDQDAAFDLLRQLSQRSNRKLRDIASEVVTRTVEAAGPSRNGRESTDQRPARRPARS